jgi:hypothetical protein
MLDTVSGEIRNIARNNIFGIVISDALEVAEFALYGFGSSEKVAYLNICQ